MVQNPLLKKNRELELPTHLAATTAQEKVGKSSQPLQGSLIWALTLASKGRGGRGHT